MTLTPPRTGLNRVLADPGLLPVHRVKYHGVVVERGSSAAVIDHPEHEYTRRLLAAAPNPRRRLAD